MTREQPTTNPSSHTVLDRIIGAVNGRIGGPPSPTWPLALARIALGVLWLTSLRWKLPPDFDAPVGEIGLRGWLELEVENPTIGLYGDLIDSLVLPNFTVFAWLVFIFEGLVGLGLLLGLHTRIAALIGLAMSVNLFIGLASVPFEWPWSYLSLIHI